MLEPDCASVALDGPLVASRFVERPNRFVVHAELADGTTVAAHLADPGRLEELLLPGRRLWLRAATTRGRRTGYSALLVEAPDREGLVSLDTMLPNRLIRRALEQEALPELLPWRLERAEVAAGGCRFDFLLSRADLPRRLLLEIKSVTLVEEGVGLFPDAVTARGTRHLDTLAALAREPDWAAALLFVAQRGDIERVAAAAHIDARFAAALERARVAGVRLLARRCRVELERITLGEAVPVVASRSAVNGRSRSADYDRRTDRSSSA